MSTQNNPLFLSEFIDELYVECDERLGTIRQNLLSLESNVGQSAIDDNLIDGILRHCHTIKGLVGTISLNPAEQLAHQVESYLRLLRQEKAVLSLSSIESLMNAINQLEQVIAAYRSQSPLPDVVPVIQSLQIAAPFEDKAADSQAVPTAEKSLVFSRYLFIFIPSKMLAEQGINVNSVRSRLKQIGQIVQAVPFSGENGQLGFKFTVTTQVDESYFADWQGLSYQRLSEDELLPTHEAPPTLNHPSIPISALAPTNKVRVDLDRLDELMRIVGELVTCRSRQTENLKRLQSHFPLLEWRALQETQQAFERQLRELREGIMRVRMVPISQTFERIRFVVRDLAREMGKPVRLILDHQDIEVDKLVADKMADPLLHLVRNAMSHGLESAEERVAQGKSSEGTLVLKASAAGDSVLIEVEDDGRGIDREQVTQQAYRQGLFATGHLLSDHEFLEVLCKPGFSTHQQVDLTRGRGIGMDVVSSAVVELGGHINLITEKGSGTRFVIELPLTLAIADALIIAVGGQNFAVPQLSVREVIAFEAVTMTTAQGSEMIFHRGKALPLIRLARYFGLAESSGSMIRVLIVGSTHEVGVIVDRVVGRREIVVRALNDPLVRVVGVTGATELGDGKIILVIDVNSLIKQMSC